MVELRKITYENLKECIGLSIREDQQGFVASNVKSLAQAWVAHENGICVPMPFAIYADDTMVGFVVLSYEKAGENSPEDMYAVWRFMIDQHHQGKGYGKAAMAKVMEYIRTFPCGDASAVYLSYEPENHVARKLYASFGFVETGEISDGEQVARLELKDRDHQT